MKGTTSSGFNFDVSDKLGGDYRLQKIMTNYERGDEIAKICATTDMVNLLLGDKGEAVLCEHVKEPDGTIPTGKIVQEVTEIFKLMKDNIKNS